jgi:tetratricopeptide (TPR) repeat protein
MIDKETAIRQALSQGDIAAAADICVTWCEEEPKSHTAQNLLGVIAMKRHDYPTAVACFEKAKELQPEYARAWSNLGLAYQELGQDHDALASLERSVELAPDMADLRWNYILLLDRLSMYEEIVRLMETPTQQDTLSLDAAWLLSKSYYALGQLERSCEVLEKILASNPLQSELWITFGNLLLEMGRYSDAEHAYRRELDLTPDHLAATRALGNLLVRQGRAVEGRSLIQQVATRQPAEPDVLIELAQAVVACGQFLDAKRLLIDGLQRWPLYAPMHFNLGLVEGEYGDWIMAERSVCKAIKLDSQMYLAHNYLGTLLEKKNHWSAAEAAYATAVSLSPDFAEAYSNLGNLQAREMRLEEAEANYRKAILLKSDQVEAHHNLGLLLLLKGEFDEGWREYHWRWQTKEGKRYLRSFEQPEWRGEDIKGKKILVHAEQGFGDTLQFVRYMEQLERLGASVIFEAPRPLERLLKTCNGIDCLISRGEPIPAFDFHVPLLNIPGQLGTELNNIPAHIPYLHSTAELNDKWQGLLAELGDGYRVGIAWAGSAKHANDQCRSIPAQELALLSELKGIHWISLYKPTPGYSVSKPEGYLKLIDWTRELHDYADTAALVDRLDLVVAVDTSVAHLAGALGKPVLILLPFVPDWRWLLEGERSPWYPTAELIRQGRNEEWSDVLKKVVEKINKKAPS